MTENLQVHYLSWNVPRKTNVSGFLPDPSEQCTSNPQTSMQHPCSKYVGLGKGGSNTSSSAGASAEARDAADHARPLHAELLQAFFFSQSARNLGFGA